LIHGKGYDILNVFLRFGLFEPHFLTELFKACITAHLNPVDSKGRSQITGNRAMPANAK